jgi:hypothetical protein
MSLTKYPYGQPVKLLIDLQGFPDGRLVVFDIFKEKGSDTTKIKTVNGVIRSGKGVGEWNPEFKGKGWIPLEKTITTQTQTEKYHFVAKIDDQEAKSGDFAFTHPITISLEDENGNSLKEVEYTITFADGSKKQGTVKNGIEMFNDAPPGKFKLELKNHKFVF